MKTIKHVFEEFLEGQQVRLKPRTYGDYEDAIYLFDKLYNEKNKEFCELFGPDKIESSEIGEFLDYFMIRKVMG